MGIYGTDTLGLMNNLSEAYQVGEMILQSKATQKPQPEAIQVEVERNFPSLIIIPLAEKKCHTTCV